MLETKPILKDVWNFAPNSAVEAVDGILLRASRVGASDAHVDPKSDGICIRMRIDGQLLEMSMLSGHIHEELIARLKILSGARTDIHAVPQDGRFRISLNADIYNIRVSFMPTYHGENAVIRLLPASAANHDTFSSLGFTPDHVTSITQALGASSGLILVTGPTGSGKTTTLRVCLGIKSREQISVMTLEDPVEYEVPGVRHVHIRQSHGVSFASGLRSSLRQDPDVIMVGEIRDVETATTAVNTALTGHLVLSTLHTNSALETIIRLSQMEVPPYLIAATLKLVVSQRLIRSICSNCGASGADCNICGGSGLRGRSVVAEVLLVDARIRELILSRASTKEILDYAVSQGFRPMDFDADEKVDWGVTTRMETSRVFQI